MKNKKTDNEPLKKLCHDLRNPLSVMKMSTDIYAMSNEFKTTTPKVHKLIETINKQIDILTQRISEEESKKNKL